VARENARPGTDGWRIADDDTDPYASNPDGWIEGYADATSVTAGESVSLFVDTPAASFHVRAFRMGWYGGTRARLVWESAAIAGGRQPSLLIDPATGLVEAPWNVSTTIEITEAFPPGAYLFELETDAGGAHYVPLTIRNDDVAATLLLMSAVTTWQAYNPWGGCSLYDCYGNLDRDRADIVSFDRPYSPLYGHGAADFLTHELPLVAFLEEQGYDIDYVTNVDVDRDPALTTTRAAVISTGHDEYYSTPMRDAIDASVAAGVNVAFFGANAMYRHIRLEPGMTGAPERRMVNYRSTDDPGAVADPMQATVDWRDEPLSRPEAALIGIQYGCARVRADMVLTNTSNWVYEGTGAVDGQRVERLVGVEFDTFARLSVTPPSLEVLAASPVLCRGSWYEHVMAYHSTETGAGVFATGTIDWICGLDGTCAEDVPQSDVVRGVTANVIRVFSAGPAGLTHPSVPNAVDYR
jgi:hypothetical protein